MSDNSIIITEIRLFVADLSVVFLLWFRQISLHVRLYRQKLPELSEYVAIYGRRIFFIDIEVSRKYVPRATFAHTGIDFWHSRPIADSVPCSFEHFKYIFILDDLRECLCCCLVHIAVVVFSLLSPRRRVMGVVILSIIIAIYDFKRSIRPQPFPADAQPKNIQHSPEAFISEQIKPRPECEVHSKRELLAIGAYYHISLAAVFLASFKWIILKGYFF